MSLRWRWFSKQRASDDAARRYSPAACGRRLLTLEPTERTCKASNPSVNRTLIGGVLLAHHSSARRFRR
jgi:hypothetical protein